MTAHQDVDAALNSLSVASLLPASEFTGIGELLARRDLSALRVALVPSIPGQHIGWPGVMRVGHTALASALRDLDLARSEMRVEYLVRG